MDLITLFQCSARGVRGARSAVFCDTGVRLSDCSNHYLCVTVYDRLYSDYTIARWVSCNVGISLCVQQKYRAITDTG